MSSEELDESQRALRAIDNDSVYNISDILSKLQRGNQKIQNKFQKKKNYHHIHVCFFLSE